jgi:acyl-CoA synthetase (AMP-forming)/AMP-acid ligase II
MPDCVFADDIPLPSETPLKALFRRARETPDATALIAGGDVWTYERLAIDVARLSNGLRRAGIVPGSRLTLMVRTSPIYAVFLFAAMMTGAVVAPLKAEFTANELTELLHLQQPALLVYEAELQDVVLQVDPAVISYAKTFLADDSGVRSWRRQMSDATIESAVLPTDIEAICLLLATSGTTGKPKLVAYNQRALSHMVGAADSWAVDHGSCIIGIGSIAHISGTFGMLIAMVHGCREVLLRKFDADTVLDAIERHGGSTMFVAPFICLPLIEAQRARPRDVRSLRVCGVGGDACAPHVAKAFESAFDIPLQNYYGLTECVGSTILGSNSQAIRGVTGRTRLVRTDGVIAARGDVGELQARGPNLSAGYWTASDGVTSHTHDGWFSTGDLMVEHAHLDYRFVGRCKDLIVRNALNISPVEVESELVRHDAVVDAAVAGIPDELAGQTVVALVTLAGNPASAGCSPDAILEWIKSRIAPFKVPQRIVIVDFIPRNAFGKVDRNEVLQIAMSA